MLLAKHPGSSWQEPASALASTCLNLALPLPLTLTLAIPLSTSAFQSQVGASAKCPRLNVVSMPHSLADNLNRVSGPQLFAQAFLKPCRVERHHSSESMALLAP